MIKTIRYLIYTNLLFAFTDMLGGTNATAFPRQESGGIPSNVGLVWRHRGPGLATSNFFIQIQYIHHG